MRLSVIVTSYNSPEVLRRCLASLSAQKDAGEIVVADCSASDPSRDMASQFPQVRFLHWNGRRSVPALRWAALAQTRGEIVAAVEARTVPAADWCETLLQAHAAHPEAPAVGGTVGFSDWNSARSTALYFAEYGFFAPPFATGPVAELSGANLSYKRAALEEHADLIARNEWETLIHLRWKQAGKPLWLSAARIEFVNTMTVGAILRQRFSYGRGYAAARVQAASPVERFAYALATPLLPLLFTVRMAATTHAKQLTGRFLRSLPWFLIFQTCWSLGECRGYLLGRAAGEEIF